MIKQDRWSQLSLQEKADLIKLYVNSGVISLRDIKHNYNSFELGGPVKEGGYSEESLEDRIKIYNKYDPAGGIGLDQLFYKALSRGKKSKGEEDDYWKAYLGLENNVPKMNPSSKTEWDDRVEEQKLLRGELHSDFYGTTHNMDLYIQAMADTTTTGKIVRDYERFKDLNPNLASKAEIESMYQSGKDMMDNPGKWTQVGELKGRAQLDIESKLRNNEEYPLGMLAKFGAKWIPEENTIHVHDTYDFPELNRRIGKLPDRPKEMKIRGKIRYNPKNTAKLFNSNNFNLIFPK